MPAKRAPAHRQAVSTSERVPKWELNVYVARGARRSDMAIANLERICEEHGPGRYRIRIVDVLKAPDRCRKDQIIAVPTVVRRLPLPERRVIGTLADAAEAAEALGLPPAAAGAGREERDGD